MGTDLAVLTGSALPDIHLPTQKVPPVEQKKLRDQMSRLAQALQDPAWGEDGTIEGTITLVEDRRLWCSSLSAITYDRDEIHAMRTAIMANGNRISEPLLVVKAVDPSPQGAGLSAPDYMIIDGKKRWHAAAGVPGLTSLPVIVRHYRSLYDATVDIVTNKTSQHQLTEHEIGRMILRLVLAYRLTQDQRPDIDLPRMTQDYLARLLGRAQSTVSRWLRLADPESRLIDALDAGHLTAAQAVELLPLPVGEQGEVAAEIHESNVVAGKPIPHKRVREIVSERQRGKAQWPDAKFVRAPAAEQLLLPELLDEPFPVAVSMLIHDLTAYLRNASQALDHPHKAITRLLAALEAPDIQEHTTTHIKAASIVEMRRRISCI